MEMICILEIKRNQLVGKWQVDYKLIKLMLFPLILIHLIMYIIISLMSLINMICKQ